MPSRLHLVLFCLPLLLAAPLRADDAPAKPIRLTCAGDSITARGYPAVLQDLLGAGYLVRNAGHSGATALKHVGTRAYPNAGPKEDADIVVVMLGTNDSTAENWSKAKADFAKDYR